MCVVGTQKREDFEQREQLLAGLLSHSTCRGKAAHALGCQSRSFQIDSRINHVWFWYTESLMSMWLITWLQGISARSRGFDHVNRPQCFPWESLGLILQLIQFSSLPPTPSQLFISCIISKNKQTCHIFVGTDLGSSLKLSVHGPHSANVVSASYCIPYPWMNEL